MTSQALTYRSLLREIRRLLSAASGPQGADEQTVADLRTLMQQFRLDFLNALDFPVSSSGKKRKSAHSPTTKKAKPLCDRFPAPGSERPRITFVI